MKILSGIVLAGLICVLFGSLYSTEIKADEPGSYIVTFKVVNGKWNDGKTDDVITESDRNGHLPERQIPAVGSKPDDGYQAGSWSPSTPNTTTSITSNVTYTYTYAQDEPTPPSPTVYNVTVTTDRHGETYANKRSGVSGTKVMLKEVPDDGYRFKQGKSYPAEWNWTTIEITQHPLRLKVPM